MEAKEIVSILARIRDQDETRYLETVKAILEHCHSVASSQYKELIYAEHNRLAQKIDSAVSEMKER